MNNQNQDNAYNQTGYNMNDQMQNMNYNQTGYDMNGQTQNTNYNQTGYDMNGQVQNMNYNQTGYDMNGQMQNMNYNQTGYDMNGQMQNMNYNQTQDNNSTNSVNNNSNNIVRNFDDEIKKSNKRGRKKFSVSYIISLIIMFLGIFCLAYVNFLIGLILLCVSCPKVFANNGGKKVFIRLLLFVFLGIPAIIIILTVYTNIKITVDSQRKEDFVDVSKSYINSVRNAALSDKLKCSKDNVNWIDASKMPLEKNVVGYYSIDGKTDKITNSLKSSFQDEKLKGYVSWYKTSANDTKFFIQLVDSSGNGLSNVVAESDLTRSKVSVSGDVSSKLVPDQITGNVYYKCILK